MDQNQLKYIFEDKDLSDKLKFNLEPFNRKESQISVSQQLFPDLTYQQKQEQNVCNDDRQVDEDEEEEQSVDEQLKRVLLFGNNVQNYPYAQGHHYFCDLDQFERDPDSVSYARNPFNTIKSTYSKDNKLVGGSRIKDIINRIYITLPKKQDNSDRKSSRAKNPSHQALFETEDKKIGFDRSIVTIRQILNNLEQLVYTNKIEQYSILKRDQFLRKIIDPSISISQKRVTLIARLEGLLESRRLSENLWIAQQTINFAPSCNQQFYQKYKIKLYSLNRNILVPFIYTNHYYLKELIQSPIKDKLYNFVKKVFTFSREQSLSVNVQTLLKLSVDFLPKITNKINDNSAVIFPIHIFSFGQEKIIKMVNYILARRLINYSSEYYTMNLLMRKFFSLSLEMPEDYIVDDQSIFKLQASRYIQKIRIYMNSKNGSVNKNTVLIDDLINYQDLQSQRKPIFVLKRRQNVELSGMEYILLMLYHWLCLIVKQMVPFIDSNPEFLQIISSPNYGIVNLSVGQAFKNTLISTLHVCIQQIRENINPTKELHFDTFRVEFDYNEANGVGVLWRIENEAFENESIDEDIENYKHEKRDSQREQDYDILYFGKRVKSLQGQWV